MTATTRLLLAALLASPLAFVGGCGDDDPETGADPVAAACDSEPVLLTTDAGVAFVRTPDACFEGLAAWPYEAHYVEIDGLRQAYVDEGPEDGAVVLLLHGQPSWSYLYRKMIPVLADAGYRVIAMDHLGMGRSDKPTAIESYSYLGHADRLERFIEELELRDINIFVQDWGSLIGLRVVGLHPEWFARVAVGNGVLPVIPEGFEPYPPPEDPDVEEDIPSLFAAIPDQQPLFFDGCDPLGGELMGGFGAWITYAMKASGFRPSEVLEALTWFPLSDEEEAAYDAPFPSRIYMGGPRTFPSLVNDIPGVNDAAAAGLAAFDKPMLALWAANDAGNLGQCATQEDLVTTVPGAAGQPHSRLPEASHFLQDDQGPEIAARLAQFFAAGLVEQSQFNRRYCEVLLVNVVDDTATVTVFNTAALNECPAEAWDALDPMAIAQDESVTAAILNGPRYYTIDGAVAGDAVTGTIKTFGGIDMVEVAQIVMPVGELTGMGIGDTTYTEATVLRDNAWLFNPGREIYELINPEGERYVMQSFSQQLDASLVRWELPLLGSMLDLPEGWSFEASPVADELRMQADGEAIVLQDELGNTYQKR